MRIDRADTDDDLREVIAVRATVHPEVTSTLEGIRHHIAVSTGLAYFVARVGDKTVGCAFCGAFPGSEDDLEFYGDICVLPEHRRQGIGEALARVLSAHAREHGRQGLIVEAREDTSESSTFLEKRGFVEIERQKALALELEGLELPRPTPPAGIRIVTLEERPDLDRAMYPVGLEAGRDIPGLDGERELTFEQWRVGEIERPSRAPERIFLALAEDEVVGYAALEVYGDVGVHGLTAVARAWRRRGVGRALKLSQLRFAQSAGLERVLTESQHGNEPMRRLNESLGFCPIPGMIVYRGPLLLA